MLEDMFGRKDMCFSQLARFALILAHHNPTMYSLPTTTILLDQNTARTPPEPITTFAQHVHSPYIHILTSTSLQSAQSSISGAISLQSFTTPFQPQTCLQTSGYGRSLYRRTVQ